MRTKLFITIVFSSLFLVHCSAIGQSRKDIKKFGIKSTTETVVEYVNGKEVSHIESIEKFDKEGNVIEDTEYNKDHTFKKKESRTYNKAGDVLQEIRYDEKGNLISKHVYTYNDANDIASEQKTDANGKIIEWI